MPPDAPAKLEDRRLEDDSIEDRRRSSKIDGDPQWFVLSSSGLKERKSQKMPKQGDDREE